MFVSEKHQERSITGYIKTVKENEFCKVIVGYSKNLKAYYVNCNHIKFEKHPDYQVEISYPYDGIMAILETSNRFNKKRLGQLFYAIKSERITIKTTIQQVLSKAALCA